MIKIEIVRPYFEKYSNIFSKRLFQFLDLIVPESKSLYHELLWTLNKLMSFVIGKMYVQKKFHNTFLRYFGSYSLLVDIIHVEGIETDEIEYINDQVASLISRFDVPVKSIIVEYEYLFKSDEVYDFLYEENDLFQVYVMNIIMFKLLEKYNGKDVQIRVAVDITVYKDESCHYIRYSKGLAIYRYGYIRKRNVVEEFFLEYHADLEAKYGSVDNIKGFSISINLF